MTLQVASMAPADVESLLDQPYVKDSSRTVRDLLAEQSFGEKVVIGRFARFALGE